MADVVVCDGPEDKDKKLVTKLSTLNDFNNDHIRDIGKDTGNQVIEYSDDDSFLRRLEKVYNTGLDNLFNFTIRASDVHLFMSEKGKYQDLIIIIRCTLKYGLAQLVCPELRNIEYEYAMSRIVSHHRCNVLYVKRLCISKLMEAIVNHNFGELTQ